MPNAEERRDGDEPAERRTSMATGLSRTERRTSVSEEARYLVEGRVDCPLLDHEMAAWQVVNRLAHCDLAELHDLAGAVADPVVSEEWRGALAALAQSLLAACARRQIPLEEVQRSSLVAYELALLSSGQMFTPVDAVREVRREIALQRTI
jgi:hypothetical protein